MRFKGGSMITRLNPEGAPTPASNYAQAVLHSANAQRLVISGQVGLTPDGKLLEGMEAQLRQCWANLFAVMKAAGFDKRHCPVASAMRPWRDC
jgi:2-iminobutanoate/2-iminopropanoate deaminase